MSMTRFAGRTTALGLVLLAGFGLFRATDHDVESVASVHPSFLYGRVTTVDGDHYEGRLRFGADEEAFWGDYFNGVRAGNPWAEHVPADRLRTANGNVRILGVTVWRRSRPLDLRRPFMARFGDIARLEARGRELTVMLKSGSVAQLDRYEADDYADGVRIWDGRRGFVDLHEREVRTIEFLAAPSSDATTPHRLHGTVRTRQGDFTGFLEWDRVGSVGTDVLEGNSAAGEVLRLPFRDIRSIARRSGSSAAATLRDGAEVVLTGTRNVGAGHRGIYVDDARYGRVLISWDAFDRVDFSAADDVPGGGPGYDDFPAGRPLAGVVTTVDGRSLAGRLVYDLDETEFIETLDAPHLGVDYTIPFGLVASIELGGSGADDAGRALVSLHDGEVLRLERSGDLGDANAGLLIFSDGAAQPAYVAWSEVARIDFEKPR